MLPIFTDESYNRMITTLDPIVPFKGYMVKRGDSFSLGRMRGSKVRQCLHVVHTNLERIKEKHNSTIITGTGLPSPQGAIVATVAKYFGIKSIVVTPHYKNGMRDFNRIQTSLAQKYGAKIYGVKNPNPSGYKKDVSVLIEETKAFEVKFGMIGPLAMEPVIYQTQNIPKTIEEITIVGGSGLSALSIMIGVQKYGKQVKRINVIKLSSFFDKNKKRWYDSLPENEKFKGELYIIQSKYPYQKLHKWNATLNFDLTYESKAFQWMIENRPPSKNHIFWVVGIKNYNMKNIEKINWHFSSNEKRLNIWRKNKLKNSRLA